MNKGIEYHFFSTEVETGLKAICEKGVTRLIVYDPKLTGNKEKLLNFLHAAIQDAPQLFYSIYLQANLLDKEVCSILSELFCSLQLPLDYIDRKSFLRRIDLLNRYGLVFGFDIDVVANKTDTIKLFRDRIDFALSCYPNHLDFPQLDEKDKPTSTGFFSPRDISLAMDCAFACTVFYSAGRAVPWFQSVLKPLKMKASSFFSDFAEWLRCNNCSLQTGFDGFSIPHSEVERMQLIFLQLKYEEKKVVHLFPAVKEIVRLNGAFSRLAGEGEECEMELDFNPQDIFSPYTEDLPKFVENVCMEHCKVRVYTAISPEGEQYPEYKIV